MTDPTRRDVLGGAAALAALGSTRCASTLHGRPIVFLFIDQLRADALGASGNPVVHTPNIDALAGEAVRFDTCVTNAPVCRPARVTMMTGQSVESHRIWTNALEPDPRSLSSHVSRLRDEAGYHTMVVGKTHLHDGRGHFDEHIERLRMWGFSDAVELPDPQQHWMRSAHSDFLSRTTPAGEVDKHQRWKDYIQQYVWESLPPDADPWRLSTEDHLDSFCAREASRVIREYGGDAPMYLQVNFPGPHKPFDPTSEFTAALDPWDPAMPLPILEVPQEPVSPMNRTYQTEFGKLEDWTEESARNLRVSYYAKVAMVDRGVGMVLDALRDSGMYDDAWIVLMSDHGELLADHMMTGKVLVYEPAIRVPLIIRPPGGVSGWVDRGEVDLLDVVSTLLVMGGLEPRGMGDQVLIDRVLEGTEGRSAHAGKTILFENMGYVGLRTAESKFGWDLESGLPVELFDLQLDPEERVNRIEDPGYRTVVSELVGELRARRRLPADRFTG